MTTTLSDDPWWYAPCLATIKMMGGEPCGTDFSHCNTTIIQRYAEAICSCAPGYPDGCAGTNPPPNCCSYTAASPIPVISDNCYCCCGCMANHTPVAVSATEYKSIEDFAINDRVYVADDVSLQTWRQRLVEWSSGTGPGTNTMIKVTYGDADDNDYLIVNRAQPFLMSDRTLKLATKLVPGTDALVTGAGTARPVLALEIGSFDQGLHHIATSTQPATSPNQHLILAKGIVCGDWALQVALTTANAVSLGFAAGHADDPELGTTAYEEANPDLTVTPFSAAIMEHVGSADDPRFTAFGASSTQIPEDAPGFLTQDQAWELQGAVPQLPPTSDAGKAVMFYLFKLFNAFYPEIGFYLDNENTLPNAYAFNAYGQRFVVVTGGLIRTQGVGFEMLAFVLARAMASFDGGPPLNDAGYSCTGQADYAAIAGVILQVWIGLQSAPIVKGAMTQVSALFGNIVQNRGGTNTCMGVSLDCRIQAMQAAYDLLPLPQCAGGPPDPALEVSSAAGSAGDPHGTVTVTFSLPVDPDTASELGNYAFDPLVDSYSARVADDDRSSVVISADVTAGQEYTVKVTGVLSIEQQPLVPQHSSATFTAAAS